MQLFLKIFFFTTIHSIINAQIPFFQDVWRGGVKCTGISGSVSGNVSTTIDLSIPLNSTIKKAYLLTYSTGKPSNVPISLNNHQLTFNDLFLVSSLDFELFEEPIKLYVSDVTTFLDINNLTNTQINIYNTCQMEPYECGFYVANFFLLDENNLDSLVNFSFQVANKPMLSYQEYNIMQLNPLNNSTPIALSVFLDRSVENVNDGSNIILNGINLGYVYGTDIQHPNEYLSGVQGNFVYRNNLIGGLNDDIPDLQMNHHDALSDISSIINNLSTNFNLELIHNYSNAPTWANFHLAFPLAYSTPCQPQNVTVSKDTVVCPNVPLQLNATGGTPNSHSTSGYEWLPQQNLSCYDCANPVFTGDSSQLYTVRIWGSDSCSVVRPVMVRVRPESVFSSFTSTASECGGATGSISVSCTTAVSYSLDSLNWQASINSAYQFQNLASGNYTVYVTDTNGCVGDSSVFLDEVLTVNAAFTATPTSGAVPLSVSLSNQSTNYTGLEWLVAGTSQGNTMNSYAINQSGTIEIMLVTWQNDPSCADTAVLSILAFDSLIISIPNIITPNNDGVNDAFSITSNLPIDIDFQISNRWGNVVAHGKLEDQQGEIVLWNGAFDWAQSPSSSSTFNSTQVASDGVYFYALKFSSKNSGIASLLEHNGKEKQGFLTVIR